MAENDLTPCATPPLPPPNGGAVTNSQLYKALYTLDQRLADRDTALITMIGRQREDFSRHTEDGHPFTKKAEIVQEKIKMDGKRAGVLAALLGLVTLLGSRLWMLLDKWGY